MSREDWTRGVVDGNAATLCSERLSPLPSKVHLEGVFDALCGHGYPVDRMLSLLDLNRIALTGDYIWISYWAIERGPYGMLCSRPSAWRPIISVL